MALPQLLTGARGEIKVLNRTTGQFDTKAFATDINVNVRTAVRQTYIMGRLSAGVTDTLSYDVDVSVGRVIAVNAQNSAVNGQGKLTTLTPDKTTAIGAGIETLLSLFISADDIAIALFDRTTGKQIASVNGCRFSGRTMTMNAADVANERLNFVGIYDAGSTIGSGNPENAAEAQGYGPF